MYSFTMYFYFNASSDGYSECIFHRHFNLHPADNVSGKILPFYTCILSIIIPHASQRPSASFDWLRPIQTEKIEGERRPSRQQRWGEGETENRFFISLSREPLRVRHNVTHYPFDTSRITHKMAAITMNAAAVAPVAVRASASRR